MLVLNCTNRRLSGSERRFLRRAWVRHCRRHRALLVKHYGPEKGGAMAARIRRDDERTLIQEETDGVHLLANTVRCGVYGVYLDHASWKKSEWLRKTPVVKI